MTMTTNTTDYLAVFDELAAAQPDILARQLTEAGLSDPDTHVLAHHELRVALYGVRAGIVRWKPHPPSLDPVTKEPAQLKALIEDMVADEVRLIVTRTLQPYLTRVHYARARLAAWNQKRKVQRVQLTPEERALFAGVVPERLRDSAEDIDLGNGQHLLRVDIKPSRD